MILNSLKRSINLFSVPSHAFRVTFMDDKCIRAQFVSQIKDIKREDLHGEISKALGKKYLSPLLPQQTQVEKTRKGIIYGANRRGLITLPTRYGNKTPLWIHYMIAPTSPSSFLTREAIQTLVGPDYKGLNHVNVKINGQSILMRTSQANFENINILGMDFLMLGNSLKYNFSGNSKRQILLQF